MSDMRLIDADALMKNIGKIPQLRGITYGRMKKAVEETPTIDAVPVVRCRECAYYNRALQLCNNGLGARDFEFYCADGAKMDGGSE